MAGAMRWDLDTQQALVCSDAGDARYALEHIQGAGHPSAWGEGRGARGPEACLVSVGKEKALQSLTLVALVRRTGSSSGLKASFPPRRPPV